MANTTKQRTKLERNMRAQKTRQRIVGTAAQVFYYLFLLVMAVIVLFPFYWMINSSLKSLTEYRMSTPTFWPNRVLWTNYVDAFQTANLGRLFLNTAYVGLVSTILSLIIQGTTVTYAAQKWGLVDKPEAQDAFGIDLGDDIRSAMSEIDVTRNVLAHGNCLMELDLPDHTLVVMVKRNARYFIPKGNTLLKENDKLLVISDDDKALLSSYEKLGIKEYTLKKN